MCGVGIIPEEVLAGVLAQGIEGVGVLILLSTVALVVGALAAWFSDVLELLALSCKINIVP
jgi:hypothetical protein